MMIDRSDWIVAQFNFLLTDFGFHVEKKEYAPQMMGNAYALFLSGQTGIEIAIDRDRVGLVIGDRKEPRENWFEISRIIKHISPDEVAYVYYVKTDTTTWDEAIQAQLRRVAFMLRQYCEPILKGDVNFITKIREIEEKQTKEFLKKFTESHSTS